MVGILKIVGGNGGASKSDSSICVYLSDLRFLLGGFVALWILGVLVSLWFNTLFVMVKQ